jgi:hypothetical protein
VSDLPSAKYMFAALLIFSDSQSAKKEGDSQDAGVGSVHSLSYKVLLQGSITLIVIQKRDVLFISHYRDLRCQRLTLYAENAPGLETSAHGSNKDQSE